ncbi:MAG: hypothetical protein HY290_07580 [Planctomycetia bacterium]|nr:hypothetical protein [Planctomycetia bacterium]
MNDLTLKHWLDLLAVWNIDAGAARLAFDDLCRRYSEPGRYYHTLDHVRNVLETVVQLGSRARNLHAIRLAAWLHDVIYDSRAADNEERSAAFAEDLCKTFSIPAGGVVAGLILKTKRHDDAGDPDAQVLLDADLAILGAGESDYLAYAGNIRREYAWVSEPEYRTGRCGVLQRFLARPRIFHFLTGLEERARRNMAAELMRLT